MEPHVCTSGNTGHPVPAPQALLQAGGPHATACDTLHCSCKTAPPLTDAPATQCTKPTPLPAGCPRAGAKGLYEVSASTLQREKIKPGLHVELGIQIYKSRAAAPKQTHGKAEASQGREGTHPSTELPLSPSSLCPALSPSAFAVGKPCLGGLLTQAAGLPHPWAGLLAPCEHRLQVLNEAAGLNLQPKRTLQTKALR